MAASVSASEEVPRVAVCAGQRWAGLGTAGRSAETRSVKPQPPEVALIVTKFADDMFNAPVLTNKLSSILKGVRAEDARQHDFGNYQPTFTLS